MRTPWRGPAGLHAASARLPVEGELASFSGATGLAGSSTTFTAPSTLFGYLFQLYFDYLILRSLGL